MLPIFLTIALLVYSPFFVPEYSIEEGGQSENCKNESIIKGH
jgi:hypothetical protein